MTTLSRRSLFARLAGAVAAIVAAPRVLTTQPDWMAKNDNVRWTAMSEEDLFLYGTGTDQPLGILRFNEEFVAKVHSIPVKFLRKPE